MSMTAVSIMRLKRFYSYQTMNYVKVSAAQSIKQNEKQEIFMPTSFGKGRGVAMKY